MEREAGNKSFGWFAFWAAVVLALVAVVFSGRGAIPAQIPAKSAAPAGTPCQITAINPQTGMVNAKVDATGQAFQFRVSNAALLRSLRVGQQVFADLQKRQVSLDGKVECCAITSISAPPTAGAASANAKVGGATGQPRGGPLVPGQKLNPVMFGKPKLSVAEQPKVTLVVKRSEWELHHLEANVEGKPVQVDYYHLHGIDGIQKAEGLPQAVKDALTAHATQLNSCGTTLQASIATASAKGISTNSKMPARSPLSAKPVLGSPARQMGCGEIPLYIVNKQGAEEWAKTHSALPKTQIPPVNQLKQNAPVGRVRPINFSLSGQFPQLPSASDVEKGLEHAGKEAERQGQNIIDQGKQLAQNPGGTATEWSRHWQHEATNDWEKIDDCWADHTISLTQPLQAKQTIGFTADLASLKLGQGTVSFQLPVEAEAQAEVSLFYIPCMAVAGAVTGMPIGDLPFVLRPRNVAVGELGSNGQANPAKGYIKYGSSVTGNIQYTGYMGSSAINIPLSALGIPPTIPSPPVRGVFPVGPVPVEWAAFFLVRARINISGEVTPSVAAGAAAGGAVAGATGAVAGGVAGAAEGTTSVEFSASSSKAGPFWFECNGNGCKTDFSKIVEVPSPEPRFVTQGKGLGARLIIEPAIYVGAQVELYNGLVMARGGVEPTISADLWGFEGTGCGTSGTADVSGASNDKVKALTADLDANLYTPWEINFLGTTDPFTGDYMTLSQEGVPSAFVPSISKKPLQWQRHLLFGDFVGSSALGVLVAPSGSAAAGHPSTYRVKMRPCYPYADEVEYSLKWGDAQGSGSGTAPTAVGLGVRSIGATLSNGDGTFWGSPQKDLVINHTWSQPGQFTLQVIPLRDKHGRTFDSSAASQLTVNVNGVQASSAKP